MVKKIEQAIRVGGLRPFSGNKQENSEVKRIKKKKGMRKVFINLEKSIPPVLPSLSNNSFF